MRHAALAALLCLAACKEDPGDTHHRAAIELYKAGDWQKAATEYEEVIKLKPDIDFRVKKKAATAWAKAGEYDKSAAILEKLGLTLTGAEQAAAWREIAGMYLQTARDPDKAELWLRKALALDEKDEATLGWLAEISAIRGGARNIGLEAQPSHLDEALKRYDAVIAVNPNGVGSYVNKRVVYIKYLEYLSKQKAAALADAETNKDDKEAEADFIQAADDAQAKWDALKAELDAVGAKIGELNKAAKDAPKDAPKP